MVTRRESKQSLVTQYFRRYCVFIIIIGRNVGSAARPVEESGRDAAGIVGEGRDPASVA